MSAKPGPDDLAQRFRALREAVERAWPYAQSEVGQKPLVAASNLCQRGLARLSLPGDFGVAALAGSTGGGKSSLFNSLAGLVLSPVGHIRPTTSATYSCVWGEPGAELGRVADLLDWLGVRADRRSVRQNPLEAQTSAGLSGLVLLDLPDMDSIAHAHRIEVDRLLSIVDLVIWVVDPQKYADQGVHESYLASLSPLSDQTIVVFNQVDLLSHADEQRCRADLRRLLDADGLAGITVVAVSAKTGRGIGELRDHLAGALRRGAASVARLTAELAPACAALEPLLSAEPVPTQRLTQAWREFGGQLAVAGGVDALVVETVGQYRRVLRLWPGRGGGGVGGASGRSPSRVDQAAVETALRQFGDSVGSTLPDPWSDGARSIAHRQGGLAAQTLAVGLRTASPLVPAARGFAVARWGFWLSALLAVVGIAVGLVGPQLGDLAADTGRLFGAGAAPMAWLAAGLLGLLAAGIIGVVGRVLAERRLRVFAAACERALRAAVESVAADLGEPIADVASDYASARSALARAWARERLG